MTRRSKNRRPPASCYIERSEQVTFGAAYRPASVSANFVRNSCVLLAVCGFLVLAVIAVFGQTARHEFINLDDQDYVYENRHVSGGLTCEAVAWAITAYHSGNWHPLTWLSHMLDCQLYGLKPGGHHLTNLLLHAAAAVLLFLTLRRMTGALWPSAWVAAVFAIHPLRVESVAWVAERKDVLSGVLFTLTLWFYARYAERPASWVRYLSVVATFALGLTAKPMLVTLPFVLLLLDYWPLGRFGVPGRSGTPCLTPLNYRPLGHFAPLREGSKEDEAIPPRPTGGPDNLSIWAAERQEALATPLVPGGTPIAKLSVPPMRLVVEKIPLFVLAAASCAVTVAAQHEALRSLEQVAFRWRFANAAVAYVAYLGKMLCPAGLAVLYPLPKDGPPALEVVAAAAVLVAISTAVFAARRTCPYLLFGWLWYLGTLVPVIGLVQVGEQAMADRYTYLTQIGLYAAIAWGAAHAAGSWRSRCPGFAAVSALVVAALIVCAWQQTRCWRDSETLWTHTLACTSRNSTAHYNLGLVLAGRGQADEAIGHYRKALKIEPDRLEAHNTLGNALAARGQADEAIAQYRQALEIKPNDVVAHNNLGYALAGRGQLDEAIGHYRKALEIKPDDVVAHNNLGLALARRGRVDEAIFQYREALEIKPDYVKAYSNLGNALFRGGHVDEAIAQYRRALEIKPDYAEAHFNLGLALAGRGQVGEAMEHYQKALDLAIARKDKALADVIRAQIRSHPFAAPAGSSP